MTEAPALAYRDFAYAYAGQEVCAVGPVSFEVPTGAFMLLTGATGSGKTTLLRSAKPEFAQAGRRQGSVEIFGHDASELGTAESVQLAGYVAQNPASQLVCDTVWHQMAFGLENIGCDQARMRRRIAEVAHYLGMQPWFNEKCASLSGGQQQLLNLASVLVMRPRILLLDEPTAQLDAIAEKDFCHVLFRLNRELGLTVVVATHAPETFANYATGRIELGAPADAAIHAGGEYAGMRPGAHANPAVAVRDCWFSYTRDAQPVFSGLDLAVQRGSIHALVGGNGCGKSTLLRLVAGVHKPRRGKVANSLSGRQALLPQDPKALFVCDSVLEELCEFQRACGYADSDVDDALVRFGLASLEKRHPYDLSGGQQQLLALAKLLLTEPDLLLLDEPTKGLDAAARALAMGELGKARAAGMTMLLATHDLAFVREMADEVTMLFDGQDVCTEPPAEFFEENLFFRPLGEGDAL